MSSSAQEGVSRIYTINLGKAQLTPRYRRTDRVVNMIREFASRHMKTDEVKLDQELNRQVWKKGKANPPRRLRVRMIKKTSRLEKMSVMNQNQSHRRI